jgi:arabinose-5-phosphate isomerase
LYLRVEDLSSKNQRPLVTINTSLKEVIMEITKNRLGATAVVDADKVVGIITDGDLRRMLEKTANLSNITAKDILSASPKTIHPTALAVEALDLIRQFDINQVLVTAEDDTYIGILHLHNLVQEGIV